MAEALNFVTPVGDLEWIFITGTGKKDLNDNDRFTADVVLDSDSDECKLLISQIEEYWEENKPKNAKSAKSLGFKPRLDPEGNETGRTAFTFWTGTIYPDTGDPKIIKVFNAKGAEVSLGDKKIGNGSRGRINGAMKDYENGPNKGVTLFLNGIQLTKFVPFTGGVSFDAIDSDDEDAFEGFDDMEMPPVAETENPEAKPRL